jgi:hypothetical protein
MLKTILNVRFLAILVAAIIAVQHVGPTVPFLVIIWCMYRLRKIRDAKRQADRKATIDKYVECDY